VVFAIEHVVCRSVPQQFWTHEKKEPALQAVNEAVWSHESADGWHVVVEPVDAAEMDEMWSFVQKKEQQRWLWHAIDQQMGGKVGLGVREAALEDLRGCLRSPRRRLSPP
jgi:IS1 transposase